MKTIAVSFPCTREQQRRGIWKDAGEELLHIIENRDFEYTRE